MIQLVIGSPGSGKTYYVVHKIYNLIKEKHKIYKHIYININGFNYEYANKLAGINNYCLPFTFQNLKDEMLKEFQNHEEYKKNPLNFKDYDKYIDSTGIFKDFKDCLIIIDECHLYFTDVKDPIEIRFLSYHRHFNIDIYLITQNKSLINKNYLVFLEKMIKALPSSKRYFSSTFRYKIYSSYQEYKSNVIGNESIRLKSSVSKLYNSGSNKLNKSVFGKMIFPIILLSLISYLSFNHFYSSKVDVVNKLDNDVLLNNKSKSVNNKSKSVNIDTNNNKIVPNNLFYEENIDSILVHTYCYTDTCIFTNFDHTFSPSSLISILKYFNCKIIIDDLIKKNIREYLLSCDNSIKSLFKIFEKRGKDEKFNNSIISGVSH